MSFRKINNQVLQNIFLLALIIINTEILSLYLSLFLRKEKLNLIKYAS